MAKLSTKAGIFGVCMAVVGQYGVARADVHTCNIAFPLASSKFSETELKDCLSKVGADEKTEYVYIQAGASPDGNRQKNYILSEKRAAALRDAFNKEYPKARVDVFAAGEHPVLGRNAKIILGSLNEAKALASTAPVEEETTVAVIEPEPAPEVVAPVEPVPEQTVAAVEPPAPQETYERSSTLTPVMENSQVRDNSVRLALRLAQDNYRPQQRLRTAAGVDLGLVSNKSFVDRMIVETGVVGTAMPSSTYLNVYSAHAYVGPGVKLGVFNVGARAMAGGVWNSKTKWAPDLGGEGRIGIENENLSIFAGVGRTQKFTRLGLDVGVLL